MNRDDNEFFIGWQGRAPPATGRRLMRVTVALALVALSAVVLLAALQRTIGRARWDYGRERDFTGVLLAHPVPMLLVEDAPADGPSMYLLVNPNKFGFSPDLARALDRQRVHLQATVLQRDKQAMLDVVPNSVVRAAEPAVGPVNLPAVVDLGEHQLRGEIVDSKCFLGAMNPGVLKPHRACAIRCISGGVPPVLLVRDRQGRPVYYVLVGAEGELINRDVLDFVAEPVEIHGRVQRLGEQLVLRARPDAIQRLP